jgi:undecaprenyl diphosphate synthase
MKQDNNKQSSSVVTPLVSPESGSIPRHVAIIMDGNGRWAKENNFPRVAGHRAGVETVKKIVESCVKRGIRYLTLFSFSTENWKRGPAEVNALMMLLREYLDSELPQLLSNKVRLRTIGDISQLPGMVQKGLKRNIDASKDNDRLDLVLALNYGAREEIVRAMQLIGEKIKNGELDHAAVRPEDISQHLWTNDIPDPDLLIRSSGEMRISNFLLWQIAYSEIVVVPEYWPEFNSETLDRCLIEYAKRERRFGFTSEQIERGEHVVTARKLGYSVA